MNFLTYEQQRSFSDDGFVQLPAFLPQETVQILHAELCRNDPFQRVGPLDYLGFTEPSEDLLGRIVRSERLIHMAETLLSGSCYHFHSKVVRKPPGNEFVLDWHQDYGSWYKDGCLMPLLVTAVIALTPANCNNGCLRFLRGSHRMGRMDRLAEGHESYSYFSLAPRRLEAVLERFDEIPIDMRPGDALFFHANTLHASGSNLSYDSRILFEITYNAVTNQPVFADQSYHQFTPLEPVADDELSSGSIINYQNLVDVNDTDDVRSGIFRRRFDPGLC